jgi:hypothetical protein
LYWDNSNTRLGINTSTPTYTLHVAGGGYFSSPIGVNTAPGAYAISASGGSSYGIYATSSSSLAIYGSSSSGGVWGTNGSQYGVLGYSGYGVYSSGNIFTNGYILATGTQLSGNTANVYWNGTDGQFYRNSASSLRYKENVLPWGESGLGVVMALNPVTFTYKKEYMDSDNIFLGLIAEEVAEVSEYLIDRENADQTGQVENVRYATIVVPLIKAIQELKKEFDDYKKTHP